MKYRGFYLLFRGRACRMAEELRPPAEQPRVKIEYEDGTTETVDRKEIFATDPPRLGPDV